MEIHTKILMWKRKKKKITHCLEHLKNLVDKMKKMAFSATLNDVMMAKTFSVAKSL